jgi:hypothetical protein
MILTFVKAEDCSKITIYDTEELVEFYNDINSAAPTGYKAEVGISHRCMNETIYELDQTNVLFDVETSSAYVEINNALINELAVDLPLDDGTYNIRLKVTKPDNSYVEDSFCSTILCEVECEVVTFLSENLSSDIYKYLIALQNIDECDKCKCEAACLLFDTLLNTLDNGGKDNCCNS